MNTTTRTYTIRERWLDAGEPGDRRWRLRETPVDATSMEAAWREASRRAAALDAEYGDDHFWTVDLDSEHGSIVQLFHGRLA